MAKLLNPYNIPLIVTLENESGSKNQVRLPAKSQTPISEGFVLSRADKAQYPKLSLVIEQVHVVSSASIPEQKVNAEEVPVVPVASVSVSENENVGLSEGASSQKEDDSQKEYDNHKSKHKDTTKLSLKKS